MSPLYCKDIQNANSSGQGYCPLHQQTVYHDTLIELGYVYSHTTPIISGQTYYLLHSYYHSLYPRQLVGTSYKGWDTHSRGMGRYYSGYDVDKMKKLLTNRLIRLYKAENAVT